MTVVVRRTRIDATPLDDVLGWVETRVARRIAGYVCLTNVHLVELALRDIEVREALAGSSLALPDGAPIAFAAGVKLGRRVERVTGSDLFAALMASPGYKHYFLGTTDPILIELSQQAAARWGADVVGFQSLPFADASTFDVEAIAASIRSTGADIVWVSLGAPKQELFMARLSGQLNVLQIGVGAVFDFASGTKRRAPPIMQRAGLEWVYRLAQEPRRLAFRYLTTNSSFMAGTAIEAARSLKSRKRVSS